MYEANLTYFKELTMYILAGKKALAKARSTTLVELQEKAKESGLVDRFILDEAKKVYEVYPELAGELAISALEYSLTG